MRKILCMITGIAGMVIGQLFGGINTSLITLLIFMGIDYVSGILVAGVFGNSGKSKNGGLESRAGWKGLLKKGITLAVVVVAYRLDLLMGTDYIKNAVIIAFCANEVISITENAGLMGIPVPKGIANAIDVLKRESE